MDGEGNVTFQDFTNATSKSGKAKKVFQILSCSLIHFICTCKTCKVKISYEEQH